MSNYTKTTDFEAKDSLPTGDSGKIIRGAEFETEFDAISTAIATKADTAGPTFTGTLTFETISDGTIGVTAFVDEDDMSSDSATLVPTQQSVKAYVDAQVTAQDLDFQANTGGALSIDLDSETLTFTGGTGIDTSGALNEVTFAIDSTVTTLTGTQTLTNKTLTSAVLNTGVSGTAVLDEDDMVSDSATQLATQQSIKAYVDSQVAGADTLSEVLANGNTTGGTDIAVGTGDDITFADSSKAIFGASSDLQIYHNGSASYITDSGTGNLLIQGTDVRLQNAGATANYLKGTDGAEVSLFYAGGQKLVTTSTGIDVTGTIVGDGLDVDTSNAGNGLNYGFDLKNSASGSATSYAMPAISWANGGLRWASVHGERNPAGGYGGSFVVNTMNSSGSAVKRLDIDSGGDISFYEDTGTTAKLFWDASAESLGIGTTSPASLASLHLKGAGGTELHMESGDGASTSVIKHNQSADALEFYPDGSLAMTLQANNQAIFESNVGIGNSSPATALDVTGTVTADTLDVDNLKILSGQSTTPTNLSSPLIYKTTAHSDYANGDMIIQARSSASRAIYMLTGTTTPVNRLRIGGNGDINFYEDTGTTEKLVWDASEESLGIGGATISSSYAISADRGFRSLSSIPNLTLVETDSSNQTWQINSTGAKLTFRDVSRQLDRIVIDTAGNVGIGTDSPADKAHVNGGNVQIQNSNASLILTDSGNSNYKWLLQSISSGLRFYNSSGSSEAMRIASGGNVGIGTSSPSSALHISGDYASNKSDIQITNTNGGRSWRIGDGIGAITSKLVFWDGTAGESRLVIDSSGNVGIGTISPSRKLHVNSAGTQIAAVFQSASTNSGRIALMDANTTADNYVNVAASGNALAFYTGASETVRISSGGNLLVGKTSDDNTTTGMVVGGNGFTKIVRTSGTANVNTVLQLNRLATDGEILRLQKDGSTVGSISVLSSRLYIGSGDTGIKFSGADDLISPIDASDGTGRDAAIDLGSSSTRFKDLYLSGDVYATNIKGQNDANTKIEFLGSDVTRFVQGGSEKARIDSSGNLLVGTTSTTADEGGIVARPDSDVSNIYIGHATGTAGGNPYIRFRYGSGNIGSITQSGTTAVQYNTSSDQRLKDNIVDAPSASDDIDAIQVRSFDWKADGSHQKYGMVAQELQSVAPEAVSQGETEEDMMGVDYSKLVPMMLKEIQSLRARVAQLEGEN